MDNIRSRESSDGDTVVLANSDDNAYSAQTKWDPIVLDGGKTPVPDDKTTVMYENGAGGDKKSTTSETVIWGGDKSDKEAKRCVGWLLVISGPNVGASHQLYVGGNLIGREASNSVRIEGDEAVSRVQLTLVYNEKVNNYMLIPTPGIRAITNVNGEAVYSPTPLSMGDIIELSEKTTLRFYPACSEDFVWTREES